MHLGFLWAIADAAADVEVAARRRQQPRQNPQQRRFSRTVLAYDPDHLPGPDGERDGSKYLVATEGPSDAKSAERGSCRFHDPTGSSVRWELLRCKSGTPVPTGHKLFRLLRV